MYILSRELGRKRVRRTSVEVDIYSGPFDDIVKVAFQKANSLISMSEVPEKRDVSEGWTYHALVSWITAVAFSELVCRGSRHHLASVWKMPSRDLSRHQTLLRRRRDMQEEGILCRNPAIAGCVAGPAGLKLQVQAA